MKILISACLLGQPVRYDGRSNEQKMSAYQQQIQRWQQQQLLIPVCPEVAGGLSTPRPAAEIIALDGRDVLQGTARVMTVDGEDVSAQFIAGAQQALTLAQKHGAKAALLAARSPSCGSGAIYDGSFSGTLHPGMGVTAALLEQNGVRCFSPENFADLVEWVEGGQA